MEGAWQVYPPGGRWRKPGFTARCVLRTATADAVGFSLGILEVVRTADEDSVVGHLGPDLLGPDWDMAEAERRLRAAPGRSHRRGPAGPAQPGRHRQHLPLRGLFPVRHPSRRARLRRHRPARHDGRRQAVAGSQPRTGPAHHRPQPARNAGGQDGRAAWILGIPSRAPAVPEMRYAHPPGRAGAKETGTEERDIYFCPSCQPPPAEQPADRSGSADCRVGCAGHGTASGTVNRGSSSCTSGPMARA